MHTLAADAEFLCDFRKGQVIKKVPEDCLVNELFTEIDKILDERKNP